MNREIRLDRGVGQDAIREVISTDQEVFVRSGKDWLPRTIEAITLLRGDDNELEPRFWFCDFGNIGYSDILIKEDMR